MGIPGAAYFVAQQFKKCRGVVPPDGGPATQPGEGGVDVAAVELNTLLHSSVEEASDAEGVVCAFLARLTCLLDVVLRASGDGVTGGGGGGDGAANPLRVGLFADGPPHKARYPEQRCRRARYAEQQLQQPSSFSRLQITAGTAFMRLVDTRLRAFLASWTVEAERRTGRPAEVLYSSSAVPGEGEHKVLRWLSGLARERGVLDADTGVLVATCDCDLALALVALPYIVNAAVLYPTAGGGGVRGADVLHVGEVFASIAEAVPALLLPPSSPVARGMPRVVELRPGAAPARVFGAQLDFLFLQLLRGSDTLPGVAGYDAKATWDAYLRGCGSAATPIVQATGGCFDPFDGLGRDAAADGPPGLRLSTQRLRAVLRQSKEAGKKGARSGGGSARGHLRGALRETAVLVSGVNPYEDEYSGGGVTCAELIAYLKAVEGAGPTDDPEAAGLCAAVSSPRAVTRMPPPTVVHLACVLPPSAHEEHLPKPVVRALAVPGVRRVLEDTAASADEVLSCVEEALLKVSVRAAGFGEDLLFTAAGGESAAAAAAAVDEGAVPPRRVRLAPPFVVRPLLGVGRGVLVMQEEEEEEVPVAASTALRRMQPSASCVVVVSSLVVVLSAAAAAAAAAAAT